MRGLALGCVLASMVFMAGCDDDDRHVPTGNIGGNTSITSSSSTSTGAGGGQEVTSYACEGSDCPACANGERCAADESAWLSDTCCAAGDALIARGANGAAEAVDVISDGDIAILCGGFGATVIDVRNPDDPEPLGRATARCQNATFAGKHDGKRRVFLAHHGDSWVPSPSLSLFGVGDTDMEAWGTLTEPGVLYEGLTFANDHLFVAAHDGGVRVYEMATPTQPSHVHTVTGINNAWEVATAGDYAFVADYDGGVRVLDITDPTAAAVVTTVTLSGRPRHVSVAGARLYVSAGGFGVDVFDISTPSAPTLVANIPVRGSAQAAVSDGNIIAVAGWSHIATYAADSFRLLATERTRGFPDFEQDFGIDIKDGLIYAAEWEGLHIFEHREGMVAADLWVEDKQFLFAPNEVDVRAVVVENRGALPLTVFDIQANGTQFAAPSDVLTIAAGEADAFEVLFTPPASGSDATLTFSTNDPDRFDRDFRAGLVANDSTRLDVGDTLPAEFGFLDPSGANDVAGLEGKVVVLAYFALF